MSFVHELLRTVERENVLVVLWRAKEVAAILGVDGINHWLQSELCGYEATAPVPHYRIIACDLVFTNGPLSTDCLSALVDCSSGTSQEWVMRQSMPELMTSFDNVGIDWLGSGPALGRDELIRAIMSLPAGHLSTQVAFSRRANEAKLRAIPEAVKERIHEWGVELVRSNVLGENASFTPSEKNLAKYTAINVVNSTIEQMNSMGDNFRGCGNGNV